MFVAQMHVSIKPTHRRKEQTCGCQGGGWILTNPNFHDFTDLITFS